MGAYLSEPITNKESTDHDGECLSCSASSMQGWRVKQEDAHNVILDFDKDTSLFAVYDGHGGAEVAKYCAQKLPQFIKYTEAYKKGDYSTALENAFLDIDETITHPYVIQQLKVLSDDGSEAVTDDASDEEENVHNLYEESKMPLEELIARYQNEVNSIVSHMRKNEAGTSKPSSSGSKRISTEAGSSSSGKSVVQEVMEPEVSSSTSGSNSSSGKNEPEISTTNGDHNLPESPTDEANPANVETVKSSDSSITEENSKNKDDDKNELDSNCNENGDEKKESKNKSVVSETVGSSNVSSSSTEMDAKPEQSSPNTRKRSTGYYNNFLGMIAADDDDDDSDSNDETFEGKDDVSSSEEENVVNGVSGDSSEDDGAEEEESSEEDEDDIDFTLNIKNEPGSNSGCTAVVALLHGNKLFVANAGDSRCVVCRNGEAVDMSIDHKPEDDIELERIIKAGGKVSKDGRVNGGLNLSRAIGDLGYKQNENLGVKEQMITAFPDVKTLTINPETDKFMILACDGIWNFMSSQNVVNFVSERLAEGRDKLSTICEEMFDHCLAPNTSGDGTGCDNMTAVIVVFKSTLKKLDESETGARKRSCDDEDDTDTNDEENQAKRPKTDDSETVSVSFSV